MDDYFGKIVVLAPTKEREMKFKIGDKVYLREDSLWNNGSAANPLNVVGTIDEDNYDDYGVMWSNGIHNSSYSDYDLVLATEQTPTVSNFNQTDYDEMQDRIELLESLLVDANNRISELEEFLLDKHKLLVKWICPE